MGKQIFNFKGMMRDIDPAKASSNYAYEIRNLRLTAQEDTTFLTLTTEKGTSQITINAVMYGKIVGYCVLNDYLVLFTFYDENNNTYIYRLSPGNNGSLNAVKLYQGNINMSGDVQIETIGIYEREDVQNVYWIDGINQPRVINITKTYSSNIDKSFFDFNPKMDLNEEVTITKVPFSGAFAAGTIQYFLTYFNKRGQQTPVFYQSPICYTSYEGRGASPEETVDNAFEIKVSNIDTDFDFIRIYSVFRSSQNGTPICKKVADVSVSDATAIESGLQITMASSTQGTSSSISGNYQYYVTNSQGVVQDVNKFNHYPMGGSVYFMIPPEYFVILCANNKAKKLQANTGKFLVLMVNEDSVQVSQNSGSMKLWGGSSGVTYSITSMTSYGVSYIDNNLEGETASYSDILFAGGVNIVPSTMEQKNNTLFFGNYKTTAAMSEENKQTIQAGCNISFVSGNAVDKGALGGPYVYSNQLSLNAADITGFKGGETYTFGIILQDDRGQWTDVIPIGAKFNNKYPTDSGTTFRPVKAQLYFMAEASAIVRSYKRIKVVTLQDVNKVVCQGALCPTVYNRSRESNSPYCQSSWFFRDVTANSVLAEHRPLAKHNGSIIDGGATYENIGEIQGASSTIKAYYSYETQSLSDMDMFIDWNTLTLHSPDIEWGQFFDFNYKMRIVGYLPITFGNSSMKLTWSSPPFNTGITNFTYTPTVHNADNSSAYWVDMRSFVFKDNKDSGDNTQTYSAVYPWHRNGSLNSNVKSLGTSNNAALSTKVMATLRGATKTIYLDQNSMCAYDITKLRTYNEDDVPLAIPADPNNYYYAGAKNYLATVDKVLQPRNAYSTYEKSGSSITAALSNVTDAVRMRYRSGKHGVFSMMGSTHEIPIPPNVSIEGGATSTTDDPFSGMNIPSLVKITTGTASLSSGILTVSNMNQDEINALRENSVVKFAFSSSTYNNYAYYVVTCNYTSRTATFKAVSLNFIESHYPGSGIPDEDNTITTYGEYDNYYYYYYVLNNTDSKTYYRVTKTDSCSIETDSTLPDYGQPRYSTTLSNYWTGAQTVSLTNANSITQKTLTISSSYPYIYLAELYIETPNVSSYEGRLWNVASTSQSTKSEVVLADIGDTYYQRYDCLKTYPYSLEDQNQIVEIFSFMCETKMNIDGRYDNLRGLTDNTSVIGANFNKLNTAYTQNDNFFTYSYLNAADYSVSHFPNQIIWTKTKVYGSDIDAWTEIPATSTLAMDGSLGKITALKLWNEDLICFQDMGIAKIMYNERTTLTTEQGVPVEIANSGKVDGRVYISNQVGCSNKYTIQSTQEGLYFIDSNKRELYKWSKGLDPLSKTKGFNTYFSNPNLSMSNIKVFYDPKLKDIYIRTRSGNPLVGECLVYSEQLGEFTSFFDYDSDFMFLYRGDFISVPKDTKNLMKMFAGNYLNLGSYKNYSIEFIAAENPIVDKTFFGVEFRADVLSGSITGETQMVENGSHASVNVKPFKTIEVWNEYQDTGVVNFTKVLRHGENLAQKFRIWRGEIGRDTTKPLDRIRSPWARIKLTGGGENMKTVIHDIAVNYV